MANDPPGRIVADAPLCPSRLAIETERARRPFYVNLMRIDERWLTHGSFSGLSQRFGGKSHW